MRYICFDVETTGLDIHNDRVIELGWAVFDSDIDAPLAMQSRFIVQPSPLTKEIQDITGIKDHMLSEFGWSAPSAYVEFIDIIHTAKCEFMVGHNALSFDKPMLSNNLNQCNMQLPNLPILDTKIDLPLKYKPKSTSLAYMLCDHGKLNPFPHRAVFDALMCGILVKQYDINALVDIIKFPLVEIRAVVSYDNRSQASKLGYYWNADRKSWMKTIRECNLFKEKAAAQGLFQVVIVS